MIMSAIKQQRLAIEEFCCFYFRDNNRVVASNVQSGQLARKLAQNVFEQRDPFLRPGKFHAKPFLYGAVLFNPGKEFRIRSLFPLQHIDAES